MAIDRPPGDAEPVADQASRLPQEIANPDDARQPEAQKQPTSDETPPNAAEPSAAAAQRGTAERPPDGARSAEKPTEPDHSERDQAEAPERAGTSPAEQAPPAEPRTRQEYADAAVAEQPAKEAQQASADTSGEDAQPDQASPENSEPEGHPGDSHGSRTTPTSEDEPAPLDAPPAESPESPDDPQTSNDSTDSSAEKPSSSEDTTSHPEATSENPPPPPVEEADAEAESEPISPTNPEAIDDISPEDGTPNDSQPSPPGNGHIPSDTPLRPLTDKEWTEHVTEVQDSLEKAHADGLATDRVYTLDPDRLRWTRDRRHLHKEITDALYARYAHVPCEHKAIIAGGLGGAGKTTILREQANVGVERYMIINPDDIKEEMARRGLVPEVEGLSPMEASDLVHEESSAIAKQLARRAYAEGKNVIWDITMSSPESTERRIEDMRRSGYAKIEGVFVDIPIETSIRRTDYRHRLGHEEYRAGRGLGGRFVPAEVIRRQADSEWGSKNRRTFEQVKHRFDSWSRYDNSIDGRRATLVDRHE